MLLSVHNHHVSKTFINSLLLAVTFVHATQASEFRGQEGYAYVDPNDLGFLKAMQDLQQMKGALQEPEYFPIDEFEYPEYEYYPSPSYYDSLYYSDEPYYYYAEPNEVAPEPEPEPELESGYDLEKSEIEMMELLESMSRDEFNEFSEWLVDEGNEDYLFTFLQMLDDQLLEKYKQDIQETEAIAKVVSDLEELAGNVAENVAENQAAKEYYQSMMAQQQQQQQLQPASYYPVAAMKREASPEFYPYAYTVYGPEKRAALAREVMPMKRYALWWSALIKNTTQQSEQYQTGTNHNMNNNSTSIQKLRKMGQSH